MSPPHRASASRLTAAAAGLAPRERAGSDSLSPARDTPRPRMPEQP